MTEMKFELQGESNSPYSRWVTAEQYEDYRLEIERDHQHQLESDLDSCADDIDMFDEDPKYYFDQMRKKYGLTEKEFIEEMDARGVRVVYAQLHPKKFEYEVDEGYIPIEWIKERLWKSESGIEEISNETEERLKKVMRDWQMFIKESKEIN